MIHSITVSERILRGIPALVSDLANCTITVPSGSITVHILSICSSFWEVLKITGHGKMMHYVPNVSENSQFYVTM